MYVYYSGIKFFIIIILVFISNANTTRVYVFQSKAWGVTYEIIL